VDVGSRRSSDSRRDSTARQFDVVAFELVDFRVFEVYLTLASRHERKASTKRLRTEANSCALTDVREHEASAPSSLTTVAHWCGVKRVDQEAANRGPLAARFSRRGQRCSPLEKKALATPVEGQLRRFMRLVKGVELLLP
jgi:hypothetical protein